MSRSNIRLWQSNFNWEDDTKPKEFDHCLIINEKLPDGIFSIEDEENQMNLNEKENLLKKFARKAMMSEKK